MLIGKVAFQHKNFFSTRMRVKLYLQVRLQAHQHGSDILKLMKELNLDAFLTSRAPAALPGLLTDGLCVTGVELPELDEDDAARFRKRSVSGSGQIAQVASRWIVAMLIGDDALQ